ncbi:C4-dicarboxylate TRAP transporter substrate-binding protein [Pleomorphochaeta sp. DL1XJH-081]|uniref:C4-dicarboxylate TRAP transporter substrate-binding protein n=1 Tax=Pleomorphochaeta sp. DL1XJH-081 TaxID=3409690 RepID=UPI003BB4A9BE
MKRIIAITLLVLLVGSTMLFAAGAQESQAEKKYVLRFNHVLTPQDPYHGAFLKWAEAVKERTNGGLTIEVYPSAQLGVEEDILEQIRQGANIGQNTDAARLGMYVPDMAAMNAPYFVETLEEVEKLKSIPVMQEWKAELERTQGFKVLSFFWVQGFRQMVTNKPITKPADLAGQRIRTPGAPIWQESIRSIGATPVAMNYGDMFSGLQTKAIDGLELSFTATATGNFHEVCDYVSETKHILLINFQVISSKWFDSLPEEYQTILEEECNKAGLEVSRQYLEEIDPKNLELLKSRGMKIIPASEIDMKAFKAAGDAAYEKLNLTAARDRVYKELGKSK